MRVRHHNGRTEHHRERVNTHHAKEPFRYYEWLDQSPDASAIDFIKLTKLTRLTFGINVQYTPQSQASYACQEHDFKHHNVRDTHHDYNVCKTLDGFEEFVLMQNTNGNLPWYANKGFYWVFSIFFLGWFYRMIFVLNSQRVVFDYNKLVVK